MQTMLHELHLASVMMLQLAHSSQTSPRAGRVHACINSPCQPVTRRNSNSAQSVSQDRSSGTARTATDNQQPPTTTSVLTPTTTRFLIPPPPLPVYSPPDHYQCSHPPPLPNSSSPLHYQCPHPPHHYQFTHPPPLPVYSSPHHYQFTHPPHHYQIPYTHTIPTSLLIPLFSIYSCYHYSFPTTFPPLPFRYFLPCLFLKQPSLWFLWNNSCSFLTSSSSLLYSL